MISDPNEVRPRHQSTVFKYLAGTMAVLYIIGGTAILLEIRNLGNVLGPYTKLFGATLILYGLFRGYKVYERYFQNTP